MADNPLEALVDQPKKPAPTRDISDLKARLGLARPGAPAPMGPPGAPGPSPVRPGSAPTPVPPGPMGGAMPGQMPGSPMHVPSPMQVPAPMHAPAAPPPPAAPDPYASFKPPAGRQFDLRPVDDGAPIENVRQKGGKGSIVIMFILLAVGAGVGFGFGGANGGNRFWNMANKAALSVKNDLAEMQKTLGKIGTAVAMSQQRLGAAKMDVLTYDPKLIDDLAGLKLDPRPDTARIFKVPYHLLPDLTIDELMNYYYDSIALYGEVERHVKKTRADKESLEAFAAKQAEAAAKGSSGNYGVIFETGGKFVIANLVEVGKPVCKGEAEDCPIDQMEGFQIRAATGANWSPRPAGSKLETKNLVPLKPTPLMDAVMSGSPEQVRAEAYKQRVAKIRELVGRITATQKQLTDAVEKAAQRPDRFAL